MSKEIAAATSERMELDDRNDSVSTVSNSYKPDDKH